ncbi:MAG: methyltransferase domain-containing protein [Rhodospirillales bacterium]|nr:methyltransferase domain-containing protein [Rhodospirillales bacterium]
MDRIEDFRRVYAGMITAAAEVADPRIVEAFAAVPREDFLGQGPWDLMFDGVYARTPSDDPACLYQNFLVAIDRERQLNNGEPVFLARMIGALAAEAGEHIVHIGTGTGYYTAVLAEIVGPKGKVTAVEIDPGLAERSRSNLAHFKQVEVVSGSGSELKMAKVDGIYVNAGASHPLACWLDALAPGGRLVLPLTTERGNGIVVKLTRRKKDFAARFISLTHIFACAGARNGKAAKRLAKTLERGQWELIRSLRRDEHGRDESCWLHGAGWCLSTRTA